MGDTNFDDYWQHEELAARLPLPPQDSESDVFFLWHQSRERYGRDHREIGIKLRSAGERDYMHVKARCYVPRVILTVALSSPVETDRGRETGEIADSRQEGSDPHFIAGLPCLVLPNRAYHNSLGSRSRVIPGRRFNRRISCLPRSGTILSRGCMSGLLTASEALRRALEPSYASQHWERFCTERDYAPHYKHTCSKAIGRN